MRMDNINKSFVEKCLKLGIHELDVFSRLNFAPTYALTFFNYLKKDKKKGFDPKNLQNSKAYKLKKQRSQQFINFLNHFNLNFEQNIIFTAENSIELQKFSEKIVIDFYIEDRIFVNILYNPNCDFLTDDTFQNHENMHLKQAKSVIFFVVEDFSLFMTLKNDIYRYIKCILDNPFIVKFFWCIYLIKEKFYIYEVPHLFFRRVFVHTTKNKKLPKRMPVEKNRTKVQYFAQKRKERLKERGLI